MQLHECPILYFLTTLDFDAKLMYSNGLFPCFIEHFFSNQCPFNRHLDFKFMSIYYLYQIKMARGFATSFVRNCIFHSFFHKDR